MSAEYSDTVSAEVPDTEAAEEPGTEAAEVPAGTEEPGTEAAEVPDTEAEPYFLYGHKACFQSLIQPWASCRMLLCKDRRKWEGTSTKEEGIQKR